MQRLVESRNFPLVELTCVALGAMLVVLRPLPVAPELGGWPLLLAGVPGVLRVLAGRSPFTFTNFDFLLLAFIGTAGIGVWAAYDPASAWHKFWILLAGVGVFYGVAGQSRENGWKLAAGLCGLGVVITLYFLATTNWQEQTSDLGFINRLTAWLTGIRPGGNVQFLNENLFGGLLAMLAPFVLAAGLPALRQRRHVELVWAVAAGLVIAFGLLISGSRGSWLSLAVALGLWLLWEVCCRIAWRCGQRPIVIYAVVLAVGLAVGAVVVFFFPGGLLGLADRLPGAKSGGSRLAVFSQTWELVQDYPLTGGGLASFAGLYSRYALMIHPFVFDYSHHLVLDVLLEQGIFGGLALGLVYLGSLWRLIRFRWPIENRDASWEFLRAATLAAFVVVGLHGLMDDALYGGRGTPLVFLLPGLSLTLTTEGTFDRRAWAKAQAGSAVLFLAGLAGFFLFGRAQVFANLGAVEMARIELAGFPEESWDRAHDPAEFQDARAYFSQARQLDPDNKTAAHRLGLLAFQAGDYEQAVTALALAAGPTPPRGVAKPLGYSYTWLGDLERAGPLLLGVTEARYELDLYSSWWLTQNQPDLAERSAQMEHWLAEAGAPFASDPMAAP